MEIQYGNEVPFGNTVNRSVQIGDNISLIPSWLKALRTKILEGLFSACTMHFLGEAQHARNWPHSLRLRCSVQPKLTGQMIRMKNAGQTYYYFRVNAFKFPGADDVYFTCAIDMSENEHFPERCRIAQNESRWRRSLNNNINYIELCTNVIVSSNKII
uniref:ZP domain-containing protein n=1 Tax=Loa loa TaxID=7209 RepID=A0A1I7V924_LOALO